MKISLFVVFGLLLICGRAELKKSNNHSEDTILMAVLMECSKNGTNSIQHSKHIQVTLRIAAGKSVNITELSNGSFVRKITLGEVSESSKIYESTIKSPYVVEVTNENLILMYPMMFEKLNMSTAKFEKHKNFVTSAHVVLYTERYKDYTQYGKASPTVPRYMNEILSKHEHMQNANKLKLLDNIHYTGLKASDLLQSEKSDFLHTNPEDFFRRGSIYTRNFKKDNNKNNANNEYVNEEFYRDENQRENGNAFARKHSMVNLNNNKIDNLKNKEMNDYDDNIINDIGYFSRNSFDDKYSGKHRKNIKEHKNDFIGCVGMRNFKKIDHILCTCARNQDAVENGEQSDCSQLINNVCLWGPTQHNKNIHIFMKMNEDGRYANGGIIRSTEFSCCNLLPIFYLRLAMKCDQRFLDENDIQIKTEHKHYSRYDVTDTEWPMFAKQRFPEPWPQIMKNQSEFRFGKDLSFLHSSSRQENRFGKNNYGQFNRKSPLVPPTHESHSVKLLHQLEKSPSDGRHKYVETKYKNSKRNMPSKHSLYRKQANPFDKDIFDPNLNIADKMQLIYMINPKRPCEGNRINHVPFHNQRSKRNLEKSKQSSDSNEDLDSLLYHDFNGEREERSNLDQSQKNFDTKDANFEDNENSAEEVQKICHTFETLHEIFAEKRMNINECFHINWIFRNISDCGCRKYKRMYSKEYLISYSYTLVCRFDNQNPSFDPNEGNIIRSEYVQSVLPIFKLRSNVKHWGQMYLINPKYF